MIARRKAGRLMALKPAQVMPAMRRRIWTEGPMTCRFEQRWVGAPEKLTVGQTRRACAAGGGVIRATCAGLVAGKSAWMAMT